MPRLESLTIELNGPWTPGPDDNLIDALAMRRLAGRPVRIFACSITGLSEFERAALAERLGEHVVGRVEVTEDMLWERPNVQAWMIKNDYWQLYPIEGDGLPSEFVDDI